VNELSTVEIAQVLRTTDSTIRSRLYRARKALQVLIGHDGLRQDSKQVEEDTNRRPRESDQGSVAPD
jgi:Sigma-70, region 4